MKRSRFRNRLTAILLSCILLALPACTSSGEDIPIYTEVEGTLKITGTELTDQYLQAAVKVFERQYPNVRVNYEYKTTALTIFTDDVFSQLSYAGGADVIVFPYNWIADTEALLRDNDSFANLNLMTDGDDSFKRDEYVEVVLDSCEWNGKQVFMPISYTLPVFMTTQENLDMLGIEFRDTSNLLEFFDHINQLHQQYDMFGGQGVFYSDYPQLDPNSVMALAGIQPMNYKTNEVNVRNAAFNESLTFINTFKYSGQSDERLFYSTGSAIAEAIKNHQILFTLTDESFTQWYETYAELQDQTAIYYPTPSVDGKVYAQPLTYAAVPENSTNKDLAYLFIKVMLSEEMQNQSANLGINIPVRKESISDIHDTMVSQLQKDSTNGLSTVEAENYLYLIKNPQAVSHFNHIYRLLHEGYNYTKNIIHYRNLIGSTDWQTSQRLTDIEYVFKEYIQNGVLTSDEEMYEMFNMHYTKELNDFYDFEVHDMRRAEAEARGEKFEE